ncbi:hypothetical protein CONPUDRAFT_74411 [Coniophora puteana RWD-64-598 SS2]|uniref:Uncharacterized protein n=1 Tax=Coniophora puteana (strain RWD-64-598) TaxID=741705 RepID=A0A5M3MJN5_CONPW|nr:uncharacterized protein CONPUDRAFT_74411 [Coniophora puteana RWD-64-598 SS2]EIW78811.1 hypothetical protein CONPUDRAFT_74411 [Coniophora puteana RWD-64-598 SS2]
MSRSEQESLVAQLSNLSIDGTTSAPSDEGDLHRPADLEQSHLLPLTIQRAFRRVHLQLLPDRTPWPDPFALSHRLRSSLDGIENNNFMWSRYVREVHAITGEDLPDAIPATFPYDHSITATRLYEDFRVLFTWRTVPTDSPFHFHAPLAVHFLVASADTHSLALRLSAVVSRFSLEWLDHYTEATMLFHSTEATIGTFFCTEQLRDTFNFATQMCRANFPLQFIYKTDGDENAVTISNSSVLATERDLETLLMLTDRYFAYY